MLRIQHEYSRRNWTRSTKTRPINSHYQLLGLVNRVLLFFALLASAGLALLTILASPASAAIAYIPLQPGDTIQAVEPTNIQTTTHSILGHNALVLESENPTLAGIRILHQDGSTTDQFVLTQGYSFQDITNQIDAHEAHQEARLSNISAAAQSHGLVLQNQAQQLASIEQLTSANQATTIAQASRLNQTLAAANAAKQAAENIVIPEPNLDPLNAQARDATKAAREAKTATQFLLPFTLLNAALSTAISGSLLIKKNPLNSIKPRFTQLIGCKDTDSAPETPPTIAYEEQIAANRALAAELLPGHNGPGNAPIEPGHDIQADPIGGGNTESDSSPDTIPPATHETTDPGPDETQPDSTQENPESPTPTLTASSPVDASTS